MSDQIEPGYYWAKLKTPSHGMIYGVDGHPDGIRVKPEMNDDGSCAWASLDWEIVDVWDNNAPDDPDEYVGVSVPGIPVTQWPNDFYWGPRVADQPPTAKNLAEKHRGEGGMTPSASWDQCKALAYRFPIASFYRRQFLATQALWDAENAQAPMDEPRPSAARIVGLGLLLVIIATEVVGLVVAHG